MDNYFGTGESLPKAVQLKAGKISCIYESGSLRYISIGEHELVRRIFAAVRDHNWMTAPYEIFDEKIEPGKNSFNISYTAKFKLNELEYEGRFLIEGREDNSILFYMHGEALSTFKRNRIGICVLHPIKESASKKCTITRPDATEYEAIFPSFIAPHQPFLDIKSMQWTIDDDIAVRLDFDGDIFETEDQRNWGDNSFKTYSTPLSEPMPVQVKKNDKIEQSVSLKAVIPSGYKAVNNSPELLVSEKESVFPKLGFQKSTHDTLLTLDQATLLKRIPFNHYRVEVRFDDGWQQHLHDAAHEAIALRTKMEVIIYFDERIKLSSFLSEVDQYQNLIQSVIILQRNQKATTLDFWRQIYAPIKKLLPGIPTGVGTESNFTDWNRNSMFDEQIDFIAYSMNPQEHATDIRTIIENAQTGKYTVESAKNISRNRPIHISSFTFRSRKDPDPSGKKSYDGKDGSPWSDDERQQSLLVAAWTAIGIRYLSGARQITLFETAGPRGLLINDEVYAVYLLLQEIKSFDPVTVVDSSSNQPLTFDGLLMRNKANEHFAILVNFSDREVNPTLNIQTKADVSVVTKSLTSENVLPFLHDPASFADEPYITANIDKDLRITLAPCSLTFARY